MNEQERRQVPYETWAARPGQAARCHLDDEAAVVRWRERCTELEDALRPFVEAGGSASPHPEPPRRWVQMWVRRADFEKAAALLAPPSQEQKP